VVALGQDKGVAGSERDRGGRGWEGGLAIERAEEGFAVGIPVIVDALNDDGEWDRVATPRAIHMTLHIPGLIVITNVVIHKGALDGKGGRSFWEVKQLHQTRPHRLDDWIHENRVLLRPELLSIGVNTAIFPGFVQVSPRVTPFCFKDCRGKLTAYFYCI